MEEVHNQDQAAAITLFRQFARGRIAAHLMEMDSEGERFTHSTVQLVFDAFREGQARPEGQQLYAGIREGSRYHSQIDVCIANGYGHPFPAWFQAALDGYVVIGGAGGRYRLEDVDLYAKDGDKLVRVSGEF